MGKVRELATKVADRNKDGKVDLQDASYLAQLVETKFPLGVLALAFSVGVVIGAYLHSLFK